MSPSTSILLRGGTVLVHDDNNHVQNQPGIDVLIENSLISKIGSNLNPTSNTKVIDCTGKIISPGFVSTHNHLWQATMKGFHVEDTLFDYMPKGNFAARIYKPDETFIGQLAGCLEQIDVGTTTALDHAHGNYTVDHMAQALKATIASGLRTVFAHAEGVRSSKWDKDEFVPAMDAYDESRLGYLEEQAKKLNSPNSSSRVTMGLGFDGWFLPKEAVQSLFKRMIDAGVTTVTSHTSTNAIMGTDEYVHKIKDFGVLHLPAHYVLSHACNMSESEKALVKASSPQVSISTTPETETQMAMGPMCCFDPAFDPNQLSLGVDCHSSNTSSIPALARCALLTTRGMVNETLHREKGQYPHTLRGSTEEAFNMMTINGARALGMDKPGGIGRIKEGHKADLTIFDTASTGIATAATYNPVVAVVRFSDVRDIDTVIVDGQVRKKDGKLLPIELEDGTKMSWDEVRKMLIKSQQELRPRWEGLNMDRAREFMVQQFGIDVSMWDKSPI